MKILILFVSLAGSLATASPAKGSGTQRTWSVDSSDAVSFVLDLLNSASRSPYGERIEEVLESWDEKPNPWEGKLHHLKLRTSQSNCHKGNKSCVPLQPYLPFMAAFDTPLRPGKVITIEGITNGYKDTLQMAFRTHTKPYLWFAPLCIKIDYSAENTIVEFYHYADKKQSEKETHDAGKLLDLSKPFTVEIKIGDEEFEVTVNGKSFKYAAPVPYEGSTHLQISNLATVNVVTGVSPVIQRGLVKAPVPATPLVLPIHDLPLKGDQSRIIGIGGNILPAADHFEIRLQNSANVDNFSAAPISLSFRFKDHNLVINVFSNNEWIPGETRADLDWFQPGRERGQPFYMEIHLEKDRFLLLFHGDLSIPISYKIPLESATHLAIMGDFEVNRLTGLSTIQDCSSNVWAVRDAMWADGVRCQVNKGLSYARFGNVPSDLKLQ